MRISITLNFKDYKKIAKRAEENDRSISKEAYALIQNGFLFDVPERKTQIAVACAIESLLIQRMLAERLADKDLVRGANQEAQKTVDDILLNEGGI